MLNTASSVPSLCCKQNGEHWVAAMHLPWDWSSAVYSLQLTCTTLHTPVSSCIPCRRSGSTTAFFPTLELYSQKSSADQISKQVYTEDDMRISYTWRHLTGIWTHSCDKNKIWTLGYCRSCPFSGAQFDRCHSTATPHFRMDSWMAEAHVFQASCHHKSACVFRVTKSDPSRCK